MCITSSQIQSDLENSTEINISLKSSGRGSIFSGGISIDQDEDIENRGKKVIMEKHKLEH